MACRPPWPDSCASLQLYFNLGTPFNIGIPGPSGIILADGTNVTYGKILRMNLDGSDLEVWLEGGHTLAPFLMRHSTQDAAW